MARRAVAYGALPVVALAGTLFLEQGERLSMAQALDGIRDEFGASDTALGGIAAAMTIVGVLGSIPFGILADRTRRTVLLTIAMAIWTVCIGLNALVPSLALLYLVRIPLGIVEANGPAAVSLLADYYPVQRRARMYARYQIGAAIGGGLALGVGGLLVDTVGWRAAFWMWIPLGLAVTVLMSRQPEPGRGGQDRDFSEDLRGVGDGLTFEGEPVVPVRLPPARRSATLDYASADLRTVVGELLRVRSMWFGVMALTISQFFLAALAWWGVDFFKQAHGLSSGQAGAWAVLIGAGSGVGIVAGGHTADRLLHRGVLNARVYVVAVSSILATVALVPAILVPNLVLSGISFFFAGLFLTIPVAPAEALVSDVVVAELRGRAASARSIVRSIASVSPWVIGVLSDATSLRTALAVTSPLYALGGAVMLAAARTYPYDLAFVAAESERTGAGRAPDADVR